jgi:GTP-binding protein EngB required for normal cell division
MSKSTWALLTPNSIGAIAVIQLPSSELSNLTTRTKWEKGKLYLVTIPDIDEAVAVQVDDDTAYLMPHGGVQILKKLALRFAELGLVQTQHVRYKEASDELEAKMLETLSVSQSPLAAGLLLAQPAKIQNTAAPTREDLRRADILNRLINPPKVVLLGAPNTGKSTLMNALTKQDTSIVHDLPGATRDAVGARINCGGLVLDLYDLPGFRDSDDAIEQEAISIAKQIATQAVLTILIADETHDWFETDNHALRIATKSDIKDKADADLCVSAHTGENMQELTLLIRDAIVPPKILKSDKPWFFPSSYSPTDE